MQISLCVTDQQLEAAHRAQLQAIELHVINLVRLPDSDFAAMLRSMQQHHDRVCAANCFLPQDFDICRSGFDLQKLQHYVEKAAARLQQTGCPLVVLGSSHARNLDPSYGEEKGKEQFNAFLQMTADVFAKHDLRLVIEPLCRAETNFIHTLKEADAAAQKAQRDAIGVLCDFYHLSLESEPLSDLFAVRERLWHCHVANPDRRQMPQPDDGQHYNDFFETLRGIGYTGCVSIEAKWETQQQLETAVRFLQGLAE